MSVLLLLTALAGDPGVTLGSVLLRVPGPAPQELRLEAGAGPTVLRPEVAAGERVDLQVPFLWALDRPGLPSAEGLGLPGDGVELVPGGTRLPGNWRDLPASLRGRSLPPLEAVPVRPAPALLTGAVAGLLLVFALRRRPFLALGAGALAAGALAAVAPPAELAPAGVTVLEGDGDSGRWLLVRSAPGRLELGAREEGWLEVRPADREVRVEADRRTGALVAALEAPGAELHLRRERVAPRQPGRGSPGGHDFRQTWVREPGEGWRALGPWAGEQPLPEAGPEGPAPPGWLVAGLPQGVPALVGELRAPAGQRSWLRLAPLGP